MNRYPRSTPRAACAAAAAALTVITLGLAVIVPAGLDSRSADVRPLTAAQAVTATPAAVAFAPLRIEVFGVREPALATAQGKAGRSARDPQG